MVTGQITGVFIRSSILEDVRLQHVMNEKEYGEPETIPFIVQGHVSLSLFHFLCRCQGVM